MEDAERRCNEVVVLAAMYPHEDETLQFVEMSGPGTSLLLRSIKFAADLFIELPDDYPSRSPPTLTLDAPGRSGLRETCEQFLSGFRPDQEFVSLVLAPQFYEFCSQVSSAEAAAEGAQRAPSGGDSEPAAGAFDEDLVATVQLTSHAAREICRSLQKAGFQEYGTGVFVHGECGVAAEVQERLQVSVDGVGRVCALLDWIIDRVDGDVSSFGKQLLIWADAQRGKEEKEIVSGDGGAQPAGFELGLGGVTMTGNAAWKARLQAGETVAFRGGGNSLSPKIRSGECCLYEPVFSHEQIKVRDIVFCQIKGRYWGHMVKKKIFVGGDHTYEYTISNLRGWENGTCHLDHIYGKVVDHWM